jgi:peptidyl-tRNA hydrolase
MRWDLGMRRGKEIAQGAHSSIIWLSQRIRKPGYVFTEAERTWLDGSFTKVCACPSRNVHSHIEAVQAQPSDRLRNP